MFNRVVVYPYKLGSASAKALAEALQTKIVKESGKYRHKPGHLVINWGNGRVPGWATPIAQASTLNKAQNINQASDKVRAFTHLVTTMANMLPDWTTNMATAKAWLASPKFPGKLNAVVCRTLTKANSGRGIVLATTPEAVVVAPLYTRYVPKAIEYRVHVSRRFGIFDAQQKKMKTGAEQEQGFDKYIRSYDKGWVFCREGLVLPESVKETAMLAVQHLGLDFGAVDIGYHPQCGTCLYEVNTAPGLEGQTLTNYANTFKRYLNG